MLNIKIDHHLKPFSHAYNTKVLVPFTEYVVTVAPARLLFEHLSTGEEFEIKIIVTGPIEEFTIEEDIVKGIITVFMETKEGYLRYTLFRKEEDLLLRVERCPKNGIRIDFNQLDKSYEKGEEVKITQLSFLDESLKALSDISFGSYKAQDVTLMRRRSDLREILPIILLLPVYSRGYGSSGCYELLSLINRGSDSKALDLALKVIYHAAFEGIFVPRSNDTEYQGLTNSWSSDSPLPLLASLKEIVLQLFCRFEGGHLFLLPQLPYSLDTGKIVALRTPLGFLDIEWSRRRLKSFILTAAESRVFHLSLAHGLKEYRLRSKADPRGKIKNAVDEVSIIEGERYFFDKFTK